MAIKEAQVMKALETHKDSPEISRIRDSLQSFNVEDDVIAFLIGRVVKAILEILHIRLGELMAGDSFERYQKLTEDQQAQVADLYCQRFREKSYRECQDDLLKEAVYLYEKGYTRIFAMDAPDLDQLTGESKIIYEKAKETMKVLESI